MALSDFRAIGQTLEVTPDANRVITFSGFEGGPFLPDTAVTWTLSWVDVGGAGGEAPDLDFTVAPSEAWLRASPAIGILLGSLDVGRTVEVEAMLDLAEAESLSAGVYSATVTFTNLTAGLGNTTRTVNLLVAPASFTVSPAFVNAAATFNGADPSPVTVTLTSDSWPALNYELDWPQRSWFTVDTFYGTVPGNGTDSFDVYFNVFGLGQGVYTSEVTVENTTNGAGSRVLPITLVVSPAGAGAVMLSPDRDIEVSGAAEGLPEAEQASVLTNSGTEAVSWSAMASEEWVSVTPSAGELAAGDGASSGPDQQLVEIRLNAARNQLTAGSHTATVTFKQNVIGALSEDLTGVTFATRVVRVRVDPVLTVSVPLKGGEVRVSPSDTAVVAEVRSDLVFGFGDVVTLTAVVENGYQFDGWEADFRLDDELENPLVVTMDESKSVGAVMIPIPRTLTLSTSGDGTGTVTTFPTGTFVDNALVSHYDNGVEVEVTAEPDAGSAFGGWVGNIPEGMETTNPLTVMMDRERTITARFVPGVTLDVEVVGDGEVTVDPDLAAFAPGTVVTLTAAPDDGSVFAGWSGDGEGSAPILTITLSEDAFVEALFTTDAGGGDEPPGDEDPDADVAKLTVDIEGDGVVTPEGGEYAIGAKVTLIATPGVGSFFVGWEEDVTGEELTATITMAGNRTVRAVFRVGEDPTGRPDPGSSKDAGQLCGAVGILGMPMLLLGFATLTRFRGWGVRRVQGSALGKGSGEAS